MLSAPKKGTNFISQMEHSEMEKKCTEKCHSLDTL